MNWLRAIALFLGAIFASTGVASSASAPQHLYLAFSTPSSFQVQRFPLVAGYPATQPDLILAGVIAPMAEGDDGTFYATQVFDFAYGRSVINTYPYNRRIESRLLALPAIKKFTHDTAMTVGPDGYLYVGYHAYNHSQDEDLGSDLDGDPSRGIAVLGPNATQWNILYGMPGIFSGPTWLQFGPAYDLYVGGHGAKPPHSFGHIYRLEEPRTGFHLHGVLDTVDDVGGIAFPSDSNDMYVLLANGSHSKIAVYHRGASRTDRPFRSFSIGGIPRQSIAIVGDHIFVIEPTMLVAYPKNATGSPKPIFTRTYPYSINGVVVGR